MQKIRVLHVFVSLPVGGAENLLLSIIKTLDPLLYESVVCTLGEGGALAPAVRSLNIPLFELKVMGGKTGEMVDELVSLMERESIRIVHSHLYHANRYARLAANKLGIPAIAAVHNTYTKPKLHRRFINWRLAGHTAAILVGSEEIRRDVLKYDHVPAGLVEVIPNSIDLSQSVPKNDPNLLRRQLGLAENVYVIGTIGRLEIQKGHRFLLDALVLLRKQFPVVLLLIGSGREESALRQQADQLELVDSVRFLGTRSDLGDLLSVMDIFVMPSLWEGLSLAMLTAMAAGLPVVATDVGGVRGVLGDNERGWVIPPENPEAIAEAVCAVRNQASEAALRAEKGCKLVHAEFSDQAMVRRIEAVYRRVLDAP